VVPLAVTNREQTGTVTTPSTLETVRVVLAHDYLSERGGAERVVASLTRAFPGAPLYTSVYEPERFPEFDHVDIRTSGLNQVDLFRHHHRAAMPLIPRAFRQLQVEGDVVVCSSSGFSHGISTDAPKIVYCHNPPRWLYQKRQYVAGRKRFWLASTAMQPYLHHWDQRAAAGCAVYLANSSVVARRIREVYDKDAQVLPPPTTLDPNGLQEPVLFLDSGYFLCVARLQPYKNVDAVVEAFRNLPSERLVVVGNGGQLAEMRAAAPFNVSFVGHVSDRQIRWLYANSQALVSASFEDFGLTPVEAALFGRPSLLLRWGGFLDTMQEGITGLFFDRPTPNKIEQAVRRYRAETWSPATIMLAAERFSEAGFTARIRAVVDDVARQSV
jgi:glycosyltransferase involved in cell wall biosynthesis